MKHLFLPPLAALAFAAPAQASPSACIEKRIAFAFLTGKTLDRPPVWSNLIYDECRDILEAWVPNGWACYKTLDDEILAVQTNVRDTEEPQRSPQADRRLLR